MKLQKVLKFIEHRAPVLGAVLLVFLVVSLVWRWGPRGSKDGAPPREKIPRPVFEAEEEGLTASLGKEIPQPEAVSVFKFDGGKLSKADAEFLARSLGFEAPFQTVDDVRYGQLSSWTEKGQTLTVPAGGRWFRFSYDFPLEVSEGELPETEEAVEQADEFLAQRDLLSSLLEDAERRTRFLDLEQTRPGETSPGEADAVEVVYDVRVGGYPLVVERVLSSEAATVWVGRGGKVLRVEYNFLGEVKEVLGKYPIKTGAEVGKLLEEKKASVTAYRTDNPYAEVSLDSVGNVLVTESNLAYLRERGSQQHLQPVFVLTGRGVSGSGETVYLTFLLPAVSEDYFLVGE